jgi:Fe(3+) dicitrate transport protein
MCCTGLAVFLAMVLASTTLAADTEEEQKRNKAAKDQLARDVETAIEILVIGRREDDGLPTVPMDSVGSRDVFGPERVRETGAREVNDLVQHIPALSSRPYNGGEAAAPSFSMRGLPDDGLTEYVNVLIDGVPASPLPYGWTAFSFLPITPDRIYAIDYIRGAHTVRYSPNTVGGVLNLLTRPIPTEPFLETRTTVGNLEYLSTLLSVGGRVGPVGLLATYVNRRGDGYRDDGAFDQQDANVKARWDIDDESWLAGSISYMESGHQAPGGLTRAQFDVDRLANGRPENNFAGHRTVVDFVYHRGVEGAWFEVFSYFSDTKRHLRAQRPHFGVPTTISDWTDDSYVYAVGGRGEWVTGRHRIYGGVRYQYESLPHWRLGNEPFPGGVLTPTMDAKYSMQTFSFHVDDEIQVTEALLVVIGVRLEWIPSAEGSDRLGAFTDFDDDFFIALPGVGASYTICEQFAAFANYFHGFRAPQVWGFADTTASGSLKFERGTSLEGGVRYRGTENGLSGAVTIWRTEYDDFGVYYTGFYENLGNIVANGVDLEVEWATTFCEGLVFGGSITFQESEIRSGANRGNETPYAWEQKAAWYVRYTRSGWTGFLGGTYVGDSFSDDANTAIENPEGNLGVNPSRVLWDARLEKRMEVGEQTVLALAVGATNLFDKEWYVHSRGGFFGGGLVAGAPRQGYFTFNLTHNW